MAERGRSLLPLGGIIAAAFLAAVWACPAASAQVSAAVAGAQIWSTDQFLIHSDIVGRDFLVQVGKPLLPQTGKLPAVYLLDGNSTFGLVAGILANEGSHGDTAPAYVVGIGYPSQQFQDWYVTRLRDLTHLALTPEQLTGAVGLDRATLSGEGDRFQRFLTQELRPLIEARYPVDPARAILAGHSQAGLFTAHVLLNDPKAFDGYIIGSPSLWVRQKTYRRRRCPRNDALGVSGVLKSAAHRSGLNSRFVEWPQGQLLARLGREAEGQERGGKGELILCGLAATLG